MTFQQTLYSIIAFKHAIRHIPKFLWVINRFLILLLFFSFTVSGQNYTSFYTGNTTDIVTHPSGGLCLMGGATEDDHAMKWFLQRANGGDILVLRTSGSDGYNQYLYSDLGIPVNSVETIVCNNANASNDSYVLQKIKQAEAIWFAGGDQSTYVSYWRNTPVDSLINQAIEQRNIVIGGTSAGMAIQGKYYFSAKNGTVTSPKALSNPFNSLVTIDSALFIKNKYLTNVITDTHFDNPDRKGRLMVFLSRIYNDYGVSSQAIACDEYTAVCIDTNGMAWVYGGYPASNDNAYFIQVNCEHPIPTPENCSAGNPLTWNFEGKAILVYRMKGTPSGSNTFNLTDWKTGTGGVWLDWSVTNGTFIEQPGNPPNCNPLSINESKNLNTVTVYPNPVSEKFIVTIRDVDLSDSKIIIFNNLGQKIPFMKTCISNDKTEIKISEFKKGVYYLTILTKDNKPFSHIVIKL